MSDPIGSTHEHTYMHTDALLSRRGNDSPTPDWSCRKPHLHSSPITPRLTPHASRLTRVQYYKMSQNSVVPVKWMAPESVSTGNFSHKSDVFSLGIVIWECYSLGKEPFADLTALETAMAVGSGTRLAQPPGCPDIVYELLQAMWLLEPSHRPAFGSIAVVLQALATGVLIPLTGQPGTMPHGSAVTSGRQNQGYIPLSSHGETRHGLAQNLYDKQGERKQQSRPMSAALVGDAGYEIRAESPQEASDGYQRLSFKAKRKITVQYKPLPQVEPVCEISLPHRLTARRIADLERCLRDAVKLLKENDAGEAESTTMLTTSQNENWKPSPPSQEDVRVPMAAEGGDKVHRHNPHSSHTAPWRFSAAKPLSGFPTSQRNSAAAINELDQRIACKQDALGGKTPFTNLKRHSGQDPSIHTTWNRGEEKEEEEKKAAKEYMNVSDSVAAALYSPNPVRDGQAGASWLHLRRNSREL